MDVVKVVITTGPRVTTIKIRDIVAYADFPVSTFTEEQILSSDKVVPIPPSNEPRCPVLVHSPFTFGG